MYVLRKQQNLDKVRVLECTVPGCDRRFASTFRLRTHIQMHGTERPYTCAICGEFYGILRFNLGGVTLEWFNQ